MSRFLKQFVLSIVAAKLRRLLHGRRHHSAANALFNELNRHLGHSQRHGHHYGHQPYGHHYHRRRRRPW